MSGSHGDLVTQFEKNHVKILNCCMNILILLYIYTYITIFEVIILISFAIIILIILY